MIRTNRLKIFITLLLALPFISAKGQENWEMKVSENGTFATITYGENKNKTFEIKKYNHTFGENKKQDKKVIRTFEETYQKFINKVSRSFYYEPDKLAIVQNENQEYNIELEVANYPCPLSPKTLRALNASEGDEKYSITLLAEAYFDSNEEKINNEQCWAAIIRPNKPPYIIQLDLKKNLEK